MAESSPPPGQCLPWFAMSTGYLEDPAVAELRHQCGPVGIALGVVLMSRAKVQNRGGVLTIAWRVLTEQLGLEDPDEVRKIVTRAAELGSLEIRAHDDLQVELQLAGWADLQRDRMPPKSGAERQAEYRSRHNGSVTNGDGSVTPSDDEVTSDDDVTTTTTGTGTTTEEGSDEPSSPRRATKEEPPREDVDHLCSLLAELIEKNGTPRDKIAWPSDEWRRPMRLLLDKDKRDPKEAEQLIRWVQADSFWRANVLSAPKFREKYHRLRLKALDDSNGPVALLEQRRQQDRRHERELERTKQILAQEGTDKRLAEAKR